MTAEEFLRSKGYDSGEEPTEGIKDLLEEFGKLSIEKETEILASVINHLESYADHEIGRFFKWYNKNKDVFYEEENTEYVVSEYRRANPKIRSGKV